MTDDPNIESPRKLTIEEVYHALYKDYQNAKIRIGRLQSEIDELRHHKEILEESIDNLKTADDRTRAEVKKEQMYITLRKENRKLQKRIHNLRETNNELITKLHSHGQKNENIDKNDS